MCIMCLVEGISTPIPKATVAKTTLTFGVSVLNCSRISSFILAVCGAWNWANSLFFGSGIGTKRMILVNIKDILEQ